MALKKSTFVIGIMTCAMLTACNEGTDVTTVTDTGSAEDGSVIMDGGAGSVHILSAFFWTGQRYPRRTFRMWTDRFPRWNADCS